MQTEFKFQSGQLVYRQNGESIWKPFVVKGINFNPTPPGYNPGSGRQYDAFSNLAQVEWFAKAFSAVGGNTVRVYWHYTAQTGSYGEQGFSDPVLWRKALNILHQYGVYVLVDVYVNFYASYNTPALAEWYRNHQAQAMIAAADILADHPAILGYLFGNETNIGGNLQSNGMNLAKWWEYANKVAAEVKLRDPAHIIGISSGMNSTTSIAECLAAEDGGLLNNFDFHGSNIYRGNSWVYPVEGVTNYFDQWTSSKPLIITETGADAYDNTTGLIDEDTQAEVAMNLWTTFDRSKCAGICYFSAVDELWKSGSTGTSGNNANTYGTSGYPATTDSFYMPDGFANEQYFGWWTYMTAMPNQDPPTARKVVSTMRTVW